MTKSDFVYDTLAENALYDEIYLLGFYDGAELNDRLEAQIHTVYDLLSRKPQNRVARILDSFKKKKEAKNENHAQ
jgi:hypothetical protein